MRTTFRLFALALVLVVLTAAKGGNVVTLEQLFNIIVAQMVAAGIALECAICVARAMLHMGGCG